MSLFKRKKQDHSGLKDAQDARARAQQQLEQTRSETPRVMALAAALRDLRERNHFADALEATFRGDRK